MEFGFIIDVNEVYNSELLKRNVVPGVSAGCEREKIHESRSKTRRLTTLQQLFLFMRVTNLKPIDGDTKSQ